MNYFLTEPLSYKQANVYSASRSLDRPVNGNNVTQIFADNRLISLATSIFRLIMVWIMCITYYRGFVLNK